MRTSSDRISALRRMSVPDLAALLGRVPAVVDSMDGRGPLLPPDEGGRRTLVRADRSLTHLGVMLSSPSGLLAVIGSLNVLERQLLSLATLHDGVLSREQAVAEAGESRALDQAVDALAQLLLAHPPHEEHEWLVLRTGVARFVPLPGIRIYDALQSLPGSDLDVLLQRLGAELLPNRHEDRRRLVGHLLRRHEVAEALREELEPEPRRLLERLVEHGSTRVADLGLPPFDPWDRRGGPLHELTRAGLTGVDTSRQMAFAWLDVAYGLRQRMFDTWPLTPPAVEPQPLADPGPRTPRVIRRLQMLLDLWAGDPAPGLAAGGIGVRPIRAAAKGFGIGEGEVGLLVHLAVDLGLLGQTEEGDWAPTPGRVDFARLGVAEQWAALVATWRASGTVDEHAGLPNRWNGEGVWPTPETHRVAVLDVLTTLEEGTGVDAGTLTGLCRWRYPDALGPDGADAIITALRALDLVPPDGPVGLTGLARALLADGAEGAAQAMGPVAEQVIVQADHTVVAPSSLAPAVGSMLAAIAELESDAGAQIWRITARRVAEALADGHTRDEIVAFLTTASSVPVPGNVLVTIDDAAARHGRLRIGTVGCYLRGEDAADLSGAVAVSAAKLRMLSPTVAVSPLSRDAVIKALRVRGVVAAAEDGDGAMLPPRRVSGVALEETGLPEEATATPVDLLDLAAELLSGEG